MKGSNYVVLVVLVLAVLIGCIVAMNKEYDIRVRYAGVFGRLAAYLATLALIGPLILVAQIVFGNVREGLIAGIGAMLVGVVPILLAYRKCPEALRGGLVPQMIFAGLGVTMRITLRIGLFFLPFIAKALSPVPVVISNNGEVNFEVYVRATGEALPFNSDATCVYIDGEWVNWRNLNSDLYSIRETY